jgi:hypothetical protein
MSTAPTHKEYRLFGATCPSITSLNKEDIFIVKLLLRYTKL